MTKIKAMIFAAGLGTRLKPFTDHHPKALAIVNGKTLLQRNIEYLKAFGIADFVVNIHHFGDQIIDHLKQNNNFGVTIQISDERDEVLETGGGLKKAIPLLQDSDLVLLMNADILTNLDIQKFIAQHQNNKAEITLAVTQRETSRYLLFSENRLVGWRNEKTGEEKLPVLNIKKTVAFAFSGIHLWNTSLLTEIKEEGKFSIIDTYLSLCNDVNIQAYNHTGDVLLDVGKPEALKKAEGLF